MGGHALNQINTVRLDKDRYEHLKMSVHLRLTSLFNGVRIACIDAYRNKPDFGDLDILIESDKLPNDWVSQVNNEFNPKQHVKNGPVFSFDVESFQVDLVLIPSHRFDFAYQYYAWNDCGNLIGRVAKGCGFKFGHEGFFYVFRDQNSYQDTLLVSINFKDTLEFLGYDHAKHQAGFDDLHDMFDYVISTPYFRNESFLLENQNHISRVRIKKRPSYTKFLEYIQSLNLPSFMPNEKTGLRALFLEKAFTDFPEFAISYKDAQRRYEEQTLLKEKFNGELVRELTGLEGKLLGDFMTKIKTEFNSKQEWNDFLINNKGDEIKNFILSRFDAL